MAVGTLVTSRVAASTLVMSANKWYVHLFGRMREAAVDGQRRAAGDPGLSKDLRRLPPLRLLL